MAIRLTLSCFSPTWENDLLTLLDNRIDVDLINFEPDKHAKHCEIMTQRFPVEMTVEADKHTVRFRRKE